WGDGKFMASVGHITLEKAKEYLEKQETHHANNSTESPPFRVGVEVNLFHKTVSSLFGHLKLKIRIYVYNPSIGNHKVKLANAKARFYLDKRANQTYYIWRLASTKIVEEWKGRVQTITGNHQYYASILRGFFAGEGNIKTGSHSNRTIRIAQGKPFPLLEKILTKFKVDFKYSLAERSYVIVGKRNWDVLAQLGIADLHPIKKTKFWNTYNSYKEEHYSANYLKTKILQLLEKPYTSQQLAGIMGRSQARVYDILGNLKQLGIVKNYRVGSKDYWIRKDQNIIILSLTKQKYLSYLNRSAMSTNNLCNKLKVGWKCSFRRLNELKRLGLVKRNEDKTWKRLKIDKKVICL
ncbi:MAG TPA: winged helix-turn-helix domain-containing protein, partial [Candidatus Nanoarchaeia archaeon]|nr:winged helix-turn-helix domain-containing protein [Candidatus Nanoarchaeia archaeon]